MIRPAGDNQPAAPEAEPEVLRVVLPPEPAAGRTVLASLATAGGQGQQGESGAAGEPDEQRREGDARPLDSKKPSKIKKKSFSDLQVVIPRDKLPPLASVRVRNPKEDQDRSHKGKITVSVSSSPKGAAVYYGGKLLGNTPLSITADRGSTPYDVVVKAGGYMVLRTRLRRKSSRSYFFKLTPAKIR